LQHKKYANYNVTQKKKCIVQSAPQTFLIILGCTDECKFKNKEP